MLGKDFVGVLAFAEDVVDFLEWREVSAREAFLVGDEDVCFGGSEPGWEDAFEEDADVEAFFCGSQRLSGEMSRQWLVVI